MNWALAILVGVFSLTTIILLIIIIRRREEWGAKRSRDKVLKRVESKERRTLYIQQDTALSGRERELDEEISRRELERIRARGTATSPQQTTSP